MSTDQTSNIATIESTVADMVSHAIGAIAALVDNPKLDVDKYVELFEEFEQLGPLYTMAVMRVAASIAASCDLDGSHVLALYGHVAAHDVTADTSEPH